MHPVVIIGLGNFPLEYHKHRHNVGFMVLDELRKELDFEDFKIEGKFQCDVAKGMFNERKVLLGKPQTYMNKSGYSVAEIMNFLKVPLQNLIVVYDDIDLPLGEVRYRVEGGPGTHNGMKSILASVGSEGFQRVRIGIENRQENERFEGDLSNYVLAKFDAGEEALRDSAIEEAVEIIQDILSGKRV